MMGQTLQKLGAREKKAMAFAGLMVVVGLVDGLVVRPLLAKLRVLDAETAQVERQIALDESIASQQTIVSRAFARVEPLTDVSAKPSETIDRMKAQIDEIAGRTGLIISSMEQRDPRREEYHDMFVVEIGSFECRMPELLRFLHDVGSQPGMLRVARLNFGNAPAGEKVRGSMLITKAVVRPS